MRGEWYLAVGVSMDVDHGSVLGALAGHVLLDIGDPVEVFLPVERH